MLAAVLEGDLDGLTDLLGDGAEPDERDTHLHLTPLVAASRAECPEAVEALLTAGADPDLRPDGLEGLSPLQAAARRDHVGIIESLLDAGADLDARDHRDRDAFIEAVSAHAVGVMEALLKAGADPEARREHTPLEVVVLQGLDERFDLLVAAGAEPSSALLYLAIREGDVGTVRGLLDAGVDPTPPVDPPYPMRWLETASPVEYAEDSYEHEIAELLEEVTR